MYQIERAQLLERYVELVAATADAPDGAKQRDTLRERYLQEVSTLQRKHGRQVNLPANIVERVAAR